MGQDHRGERRRWPWINQPSNRDYTYRSVFKPDGKEKKKMIGARLSGERRDGGVFFDEKGEMRKKGETFVTVRPGRERMGLARGSTRGLVWQGTVLDGCFG